VTVTLYPMPIEPCYDLAELNPLNAPHAVNDLWTEVSGCSF
jgi:hypothetical protein